jgi:DNA-binding MarR family transcriptional regulator
VARASDWDKLEAAKQASTGQLLLKCARLLDERAVARVNRSAPKVRLRPAHTSLLPHIDREGTRLTALAARRGISKQAIDQLVSDLERMGAVERTPDPADGRAKLVRFTARGLEAIHHGLGVLRDIERELERRVGPRAMQSLHATLAEVLVALEALDQPAR